MIEEALTTISMDLVLSNLKAPEFMEFFWA